MNAKSPNGFVSFVSSGPGDPELLTLKAIKRIEAADVVLYDDLSAGKILEFARSDADLIGVGKRAGRNSPKQDHVSRLLVDYALSGAKTVRLKSGDSGIFGRLEEEITELRHHGIGYEIIPGVPSAIAAAASAKIPLTRRIASRRVQFITGHDVSGELPDDFDFSALCDERATTAIFMGKRTFPKLAQRLMEQGLPSETPAMLCENISHENEKISRYNLSSLKDYLENYTSSEPALIIIGPLMDSELGSL